MATPTKLLLSPKILSTSPVGFGRKKIENFLHARTPTRNDVDVLPRKIKLDPSKVNSERVKVKVTAATPVKKAQHRNCLKVNTPCKEEILENGLGDLDLNILGRGSFGTVVKGIYKGERVAMKVIKLNSRPKRIGESFAIGLEHPNVVRTLEVIENESKQNAIVIMESLESYFQLQTILNHHKLNEKTVVKYAMDIASALVYCHSKKILHLDVKPQNVLVRDDTCKLCDFGSCYRLNEETDYRYEGTIPYSAPELLIGRRPTEKCDVYSFGIVFWQMIHNKDPYAEIDRYEILVYKIIKFNVRPNCNEGDHKFKDIYVKCWDTDPILRPSAEAVLNELKEIKFN